MQTQQFDGKEKTRGLFLMKKSTAINQYLKEQASLDLLRFITCGSVDDGKSTLIGRMLYESQMIFDDQVASLKKTLKNMALKVKRLISLYL